MVLDFEQGLTDCKTNALISPDIILGMRRWEGTASGTYSYSWLFTQELLEAQGKPCEMPQIQSLSSLCKASILPTDVPLHQDLPMSMGDVLMFGDGVMCTDDTKRSLPREKFLFLKFIQNHFTCSLHFYLFHLSLLKKSKLFIDALRMKLLTIL